jgi:hypothetical protein
MNPDKQNHLYLVFLHILVKLHQISFLGYMQRTLKAVPHSVYTCFWVVVLVFGWLSSIVVHWGQRGGSVDVGHGRRVSFVAVVSLV